MMRMTSLYSIGPEEPEYGWSGEVITVMTRLNSQIPYAYLFRATDRSRWELTINSYWNIVINARYLTGRLYEQWKDALPELDLALQGPWDLNAGRYDKLADIYDKSANLIQQGWTQFALARDKEGRIVPNIALTAEFYCLTGALCKLDRFNYYPNMMPLIKYLDLTVPAINTGQGSKFYNYERALTLWNDNPERTQADVVNALRNTADILRESALNKQDYYLD